MGIWKKLIAEIVNEFNEKSIPIMSEDEEEELEKLHGESLKKPINKEDYEPLPRLLFFKSSNK